ncbi:MAG: PHP domain-containing protein, partial [Vulcanimicrobiaceae bacterium]
MSGHGATYLKVDFHSHTCRSDGTLTPQELAAFMAERGVEIFSISDHDTLSAYGEFDVPSGSQVVTGVEINTTYRDNEVHILGYALPLEGAPHLNAMIERNRSARLRRVDRMVEQLRRAGYGITSADVLRAAGEANAIGRPHVARALVEAGAAPDIEWTFRNLLRSGKPGYVPSLHVTPKEAIEAIHASGGIAVLAHPGRLKDRGLIDELAEYGLDGLEVFYPLHDADEVAFFRRAAARYG